MRLPVVTSVCRTHSDSNHGPPKYVIWSKHLHTSVFFNPLNQTKHLDYTNEVIPPGCVTLTVLADSVIMEVRQCNLCLCRVAWARGMRCACRTCCTTLESTWPDARAFLRSLASSNSSESRKFIALFRKYLKCAKISIENRCAISIENTWCNAL